MENINRLISITFFTFFLVNTLPGECGGLYEGPTGGQTIPIILPNSKIMVRISPNLHIGSLYKKHPIGRGVLPDYSTEYTIDDILLNKDLEMKLAQKIMEEKK